MKESKYNSYLEEYEKSKLSIKAFCEEKGLCSSGFYYFYKRYKERTNIVVVKPKENKEESNKLTIKTNISDMSLEASVSSSSELEMILEAMYNVQKRR